MGTRLVMVCEACQNEKHHACMDEGTCVCALRRHDGPAPIQNATPVFRPEVS